jgi:hypothetical protein
MSDAHTFEIGLHDLMCSRWMTPVPRQKFSHVSENPGILFREYGKQKRNVPSNLLI